MSDSKLRKIAVVTSSRADYGILRWLIGDMSADPLIDCRIIATGSHFVPELGLTYRAILADGFEIDRRIEIQLASDTVTGMAKSAGLTMLSFSDALADLSPDIVVVLGDRYEVAAASLAAFLLAIPVAHISGGEKTSGAIDDSLRHVITKSSRFHFVAAEDYRRRVLQLGEQPDYVFNVGDPGIDNIHRLTLLDREATAARLGFDPSRPFFLVTYHPATGENVDQAGVMSALLAALDRFPDYDVALTMPNTDAGSRAIGQMAIEYAASRSGRVHLSPSLGQVLYLSAMMHCAAVVGNSSSGIVEAPALKKAAVNIGLRQEGRLKAASIIDCGTTELDIYGALDKAVSPDFQAMLPQVNSLYGDTDASRKIHNILREVDLSNGIAKDFYDLG